MSIRFMYIKTTYSRCFCLALLFVLFSGSAVEAQDTLKTPLAPFSSAHKTDLSAKLDCRLTLEAGVGSIFGYGFAFSGVTPEIRYHFNERFAMSAGVKVLSGFGLGVDYELDTRHQRSLAPRRSGRLVETYVSGEYQVTDRLWVAASLLHIGGNLGYVPFYGKGDYTVSATGLFADLRYRTRSGSLLGFHLSYINDRNGLLAPYLYGPYMDDLFWRGETMGFGFDRSFGFYY